MASSFTCIPNEVINRDDLSHVAFRLYAVLKMHNNKTKGCFPSQECLSKEVMSCRRSINYAMEELEQAGLIERNRRGRGKTTEYHFPYGVQQNAHQEDEVQQGAHQNPSDVQQGALPDVQQGAHPYIEQDEEEQDEVLTPMSDFAQLNINKPSPESSNGRHIHGALLVDFERWYASYPKKQAKAKAEQEWAKIRPDSAMTEHMIRAVEAQSKTVQWQKEHGQFIPMPPTWLHQRRWEDDLVIRPNGRVSEMPKGFQ